MFIDLVDKLIDRLIALVKLRKESRQLRFTTTVAPVFVEFEKVHENYLSTFRRFRTMLTTGTGSLNEVIQQISEEYLFSRSRREKLLILLQSDDKPVPDEIRRFFTLLGYYLLVVHGDGRIHQRWYCALAEAYSYLQEEMSTSSSEKVWQFPKHNILHDEGLQQLVGDATLTTHTAIWFLDLVLECIQDYHAAIVKEYQEVRRRLDA